MLATIYETSTWIEACAIQGTLRKVCVDATISSEWFNSEPVYGVCVPQSQVDAASNALYQPAHQPSDERAVREMMNGSRRRERVSNHAR